SERAMRKRAAVTIIVASSMLTIAASQGCDGVYSSNDPGNGSINPDAGTLPGGTAKALAKANFDANVAPFLQSTCVVCHGSGVAAYPQFLAPPDIYSSLMKAQGLVVPGNPDASELYTYAPSAAHSGTKPTPDQAKAIHDWILLEPSDIAPDAGVGVNTNTALL